MQCVHTPRIMPGTCLESHMVTVQPPRKCTPPALGKWAHSDSPRFQAMTSIIAINVRTCLCLCNCLVYTPMPRVVCINCGWIGLKDQFIKTRGGCQEQTRAWERVESVPRTLRLKGVF